MPEPPPAVRADRFARSDFSCAVNDGFVAGKFTPLGVDRGRWVRRAGGPRFPWRGWTGGLRGGFATGPAPLDGRPWTTLRRPTGLVRAAYPKTLDWDSRRPLPASLARRHLLPSRSDWIVCR